MNRYQEQHVEFHSSVKLAGTLVIPNRQKETCPAVVIIGGTGDNDRDGFNQTKKIDLTAYRELAHYLGEIGFMSLRYDKRGCGTSEGDYYETGFWDLVEDAAAAVRHLKSDARVSSVILLGHSEGAMIAPAVFEREKVDGMVLLSGVGEPSKIAFHRQTDMLFDYLSGMKGLKGFFIRKLHLVEKAKKKNEDTIQKILSSPAPVYKIKKHKFNAKWHQEQFEYNVLDYLPQITCPVLAITGSKDLQVDPEQARVIAESVSGEAEWEIIPDLTHILRKTDVELTPLNIMKEYKKEIQQPIDDELKSRIGTWLNRQFRSEREN